MDHIFMIAEAGVNHNGSIEIAKQLIDEAVRAGADAVKFQSFYAEKLTCRTAGKAAYQMDVTDKKESQYDMLQRLQMSREMHQELFDYCGRKGISFLSSPFDIESAKMLADMGVLTIKIPSGEITNLPYLRAVARLGKKVLLSTGMSTLEEVRTAVGILREYGVKDLIVLQCNTQYPTPAEDVNLRAMIQMKEQLGVPVGYSDHTQGIEIALAAAALGACVIEKHFTLDKNMEGPDHKASIEPQVLKQMIHGIRRIEQALGDGIKCVSQSEKVNMSIVRKSIVAGKEIQKGETLTEKNLAVKRPGTGLSPMKWDQVIGRKADRNYRVDELIRLG